MLIAIGCSNALGTEERLAKLESQHPTSQPQTPRPPALQLHGNVSGEVSKDNNTLSSLTFKMGAGSTPSFSVIRYSSVEHTEIFEAASTVSKLDAGGYEIRLEGLHIGTNTTFSLEVVQTPKASVLYIQRTTPTEFTTGVVDLDR